MDRFYNLKIGIPWADLERRLDPGTVLSLVGDVVPWRDGDHAMCMGVDTGKDHHVVILRKDLFGKELPALIDLVVCQTFEELDDLMERFQVSRCVIDALPETHSTRAFAKRHLGNVYLSFFNQHQRGSANWDLKKRRVDINRTEALDASRAIIRERGILLSRRASHLQEFAKHMACDAKILEEDPDTGAKKYRYVRTGEDHFSLAFTYAVMAVTGFSIPRVY